MRRSDFSLTDTCNSLRCCRICQTTPDLRIAPKSAPFVSLISFPTFFVAGRIFRPIVQTDPRGWRYALLASRRGLIQNLRLQRQHRSYPARRRHPFGLCIMNRLSRRLFFASIVSGFGAICFAPPAGAQSFTGDEPLEVFGLKSAQPQQVAPVVTALAINADGSILATAGDDHFVNLWRIDDGKLAHQLLGHGDWVRAVQFSPDGKLLASAGDDRGIRLWNPATGELVRTFARHATSIYALDFSPDGKTIAAAGFENVVRIYDVATGHFVRSLKCPCNDLRAVAFSRDGSRLVAGGRDGHVRIWNVADGTVAQDWEAHDHRIRAIAFSPDGDQLASAGEDRYIHVWDVATAQERAKLDGGGGKVMSICFCGPGRLAAGSSDNLLRVWDLASQQLIKTFTGHSGHGCRFGVQRARPSAGFRRIRHNSSRLAAKGPGRWTARRSWRG